MKKIALIYPPIDDDYCLVGVNDCPPLGLAVIHNYVMRKALVQTDIDIFDGEHTTVGDLENIIVQEKYDVVGVQPMMASYNMTLRLLKAAKESGATTVLGSHHATHLYRNILRNRHHLVDCIVLGDGEEAFCQIVNGMAFSLIPNLAYWDEGEIKTTPQQNVAINESYIDCYTKQMLSQYNKRAEAYEHGSETTFRAFSHKGCKNRLNSQYCYFCGRADKGFRFKDPEIYLRELDYFVNSCQARHVFEAGDDFLQDEDWLRELIRIKEKKYPNLHTKLRIFARSNRIVESVIPLLHELHIDGVIIGFESGSDRILSIIHKHATTSDNLQAANLLFSNGIDTLVHYVVGLPGEDKQSLDETYQQAQYVQELSFKYMGRKPEGITGNLIEINPGATAFKQLVKAFPQKYADEDILSVKETQNDYFKMIFGLNTDREVMELRKFFAGYAKKINALGRYTYPAGWLQEDFS